MRSSSERRTANPWKRWQTWNRDRLLAAVRPYVRSDEVERIALAAEGSFGLALYIKLIRGTFGRWIVALTRERVVVVQIHSVRMQPVRLAMDAPRDDVEVIFFSRWGARFEIRAPNAQPVYATVAESSFRQIREIWSQLRTRKALREDAK